MQFRVAYRGALPAQSPMASLRSPGAQEQHSFETRGRSQRLIAENLPLVEPMVRENIFAEAV